MIFLHVFFFWPDCTAILVTLQKNSGCHGDFLNSESEPKDVGIHSIPRIIKRPITGAGLCGTEHPFQVWKMRGRGKLGGKVPPMGSISQPSFTKYLSYEPDHNIIIQTIRIHNKTGFPWLVNRFMKELGGRFWFMTDGHFFTWLVTLIRIIFSHEDSAHGSTPARSARLHAASSTTLIIFSLHEVPTEKYEEENIQ